MKIRIDDIEISVKTGMTVMEAAASIGIEIPSMCFLKGHSNNSSCMVCLVEDETTGKLFPSCAMPVSDDMHILTGSPEVMETRREALELLLSDHLGDCEAPCRLSCPAFMNIPLMNRLIAQGDFAGALKIVRQEIALPLILGYICPAPCEKACHRRGIDGAIAICLLKRFTATGPVLFETLPFPDVKTGKKTAIIGAGPAGLSAAFYLLKSGHDCVLFDEMEEAGGSLRSIPEDILPKAALEAELEVIRRMGGEFRLKVKIDFSSFRLLKQEFEAVILATGYNKEKPGLTENLPEGFFICGNPDREEKMAVRSAAYGNATAHQVNAFLGKHPETQPGWNFFSRTGKLTVDDHEAYLKEGAIANRVEPVKGLLAGFSATEAMLEASRCMHCDCRKPVSCKLRRYAAEYGIDRKHYAANDRKKIVKELQHERVVYEPQKCIRCGLCVEISSNDPSSAGMAFFGRGYEVEVGFALNAAMKDALAETAEECVKACPTGALSHKTGSSL